MDTSVVFVISIVRSPNKRPEAARKTAQKTYPVEVVKYERISRLYTANI